MNRTATSPAIAADWMAAGVRHEILMRVLPTLRHDLLGPIWRRRTGCAGSSSSMPIWSI